MWYMLEDYEKHLYHYTRASKLLDHILPRARLRFSRFEFVNDPREAKDWVFSLQGSPADPNFDLRSLQTELNRHIKHSWRIGCFVSDVREGCAPTRSDEPGKSVLGALYERGHSRPRMWAQYGDDYRGACLIFDKARLGDAIKSAAIVNGLQMYSGKIRYEDTPTAVKLGRPNALTISIAEVNRSGFKIAASNHLSRHWQDVFFVKQRDWEQEREFRWAVNVDTDEDFFVDIQGSLVGVLLGDRFDDSLKARVGEFAVENGFEVAIMSWQNGVPQPQPTHGELLREMGQRRGWTWKSLWQKVVSRAVNFTK